MCNARERYHLGARLHARSLLGEDELAAVEIPSRLGQERRDLQREDVLSVQILMQAVVIVRSVLQQERRRQGLSGAMAALEEGGVLGGKAHLEAEPLVPAVGDRREMRVERGAQLLHQRRQRIGEIPILAAAEAVACHHHAAAKRLIAIVECAHRRAFLPAEQGRQARKAARVERGVHARPVD